MIDPLRRNVGFAFGALLASSATLVCCVIPAVLVSLGAGAVLVGLVSSFPVTAADGAYTIVPGLDIDEVSRARIDASVAELVEEREAVRALGLV